MSSNYNPLFNVRWEKTDLYSIGNWINGIAFKKINFDKSGKYPVIKINELKYGITSQTAFTNQIFDSCYALSKGDLLFSWSGSPETSIDTFWYDLMDGWLNQHIFKVLPANGFSKEFIFYLLKYIKPEVIRIAKDKQTTGLGHITKGDMKQIIISFPKLNEQIRLVAIVKSLDDKILLNRQTNQTLEAMAQTLFKEMCLPKGDVLPEGWRVGKLGEVLQFRNGKSSPERNDTSQYPVYGANGVIGYSDSYNSKEKSSVIGRVGSYCGAVYFTLSKSYITDNAIIAESKNENGSMFCYHILQKLNLNNFKVGSGQPLLNQAILSSIDIVIPSELNIRKFEMLALSFFDKIYSNIQENQTLIALRDSLLPRLMKGEIEV